MPGEIPSIAACGTGTSSPIVTDSTLSAGYSYWVGVAAVDNVGNAGPISELVCSTPDDVDDFWSDYLSSGGTGGGGLCSCATVGVEHTRLAMGGWALAFLMLSIRRRRRREERA